MSAKQDKATTDRHAKTLRELLKRPENKVCADCKRNDPRWASWNLGVFLCIRCSGIHRSMGTHISKVKSVDLDVWTIEQMSSITKWGNKRANIYWEAHLKAGHIPPDHKMESFIRSKYESRRWAMDGPPPSDPSVLEDGVAEPAPEPVPQAIPSPTASRPSHATTSSTSSARSPVTNRQPQPHHQLLSTSIAGRNVQAAPQAAAVPAQQAAAAPAAPAPAAPSVSNDLFSLDFHNPTPATAASPPPKKDVKQDILSLFSTSAAAAPAAAPPSAFGQFGAAPAQANVWGGFAAVPAAAPAQQANAFAAPSWGAPQQNMWNAPAAQPAPAQPAQQNLYNTNDIWASSGANAAGAGGDPFGSTLPAKKDDVFGDIWGGFK
ncbi:ArfGap-domain-containing protein [Phanerochaete sordida]|uniref:ArfGap-domain-containing protein n=1 Tax=Phanerochaete sordida TaxID=48140 RepID=A0A9P3GQP9_9APHY|nr:ArfGap-domain-containing protein [Phanerochaete sordida]